MKARNHLILNGLCGCYIIPKICKFQTETLPTMKLDDLPSFDCDRVKNAINAVNAKKALSDSNIDVDAVLDATMSIGGGVQSAEFGKEPFVHAKTRFMGSFSLDAGKYIRVTLRYMSEFQMKMSDTATGGLVGRVFDKGSKSWIFVIPETKASDGKSIATVKDLLKFAGKDEEATKLFGA